MKHLVIKNLGPISSADLELLKINVIVGPQSSGKSCVLKTASYCTWVEKRISLAQSAEQFETGDSFIQNLVTFHKLHGYVKENTYVEYESDLMRFSFDAGTGKFEFRWNAGRWNYHRSKVTYIPAERNMVAVIPNWFEVKLAEDNIRDFMSDWETARQATTKDVEVLNLGVSYHYDPASRNDKVVVSDKKELNLTNTSSGLQSLIPLFVHLNYLDVMQHVGNKYESIKQINEKGNLANVIYKGLFGKGPEHHEVRISNKGGEVKLTVKGIGKHLYVFTNKNDAEKFEDTCKNYTESKRCDIFLEEPELNLFPPTQSILADWLLDMTDGKHSGTLFVSTHSPYLVTSFLEKKRDDIGLMITDKPKPEGIVVKSATKEETQAVYEYGVDVFFNYEMFSEDEEC